MRRLPFTPFCLLVLLLSLGACNTISGLGQDIEAGGEAISDTAEDTKEKM